MSRLSCIVALTVVAAAAGCQTADTTGDFRVDPRAPFVRANLADIVATPHEYRESDVVFSAIFNNAKEVIFIPAYTPFTEEKYIAFAVWMENVRYWITAENVKGQVRTIYMRKDNPNLSRLLKIKQYQPVIVKGMIKSHFNDTPWIEAFDIRAVGSPVCSSTGLRALLMGLDAAAANDVDKAHSLFRTATSEIDSDSALVDCNLTLARALVKRRTLPDIERSLGYFKTAVSYSNNDGAIRGEWERAQLMAEMLRKGESLDRFPELPETGATGVAAPTGVSIAALKELQAELENRKAEIERLKQAMADAGAPLRDALARAHDENAQLTAQIEKVRGEAAEAARQIDEVKGEKASLETKIQQFQTEMNSAVEQREQIRQELEVAQAARARAEERQTMLEQQLVDANTKIGDLEKAMSAGGDEAKAKVVELERAKSDLESKLQAAESEKANLQTELDKARAGAGGDEALKAKVAELEGKIQTVEGEKTALMAELEKAKADAGGDETLKAKVAELDAKVQDLEAQKTTLQQELDKAKAAGGVDEKALRKEIAKEYEEEIADYQKLLTRQRGMIKELEDKIKQLEEKIKELEKK